MEGESMSRYRPLADFLATQKSGRWDATFDEIEKQLGFPLPNSAYRYPAWWANQSGNGHSQTAGWRSAGWRTAALDLAGRRVRFERDAGATPREAESSIGSDPNGHLFARAQELTGITDADRLIAEALQALIMREAALRLARLGGAAPNYKAPPRERPVA
jgi:hypothetical protein